jgi:hypothetical protein
MMEALKVDAQYMKSHRASFISASSTGTKAQETFGPKLIVIPTGA